MLVYYNIFKQKVIIACHNYEGFQHNNFIFSQIFISKFKELLNDETDPRLR
jgi:hypothetical protein